MGILADKQKKMREAGLSKEEQKIRYEDFIQSYSKLRDREDKRWYSNLSLYKRKNLHPLLLSIYHIKNKLSGFSYEIISDKHSSVDKPVIFAVTHIGKFDIEVVSEAIKEHYYLLSGDFEHLYGHVDAVFLGINGVIYFNEILKEERQSAKDRMIQILQDGGNLMYFPEGTWNMSPNLPVLPLYWGIIDIAKKTGAIIQPVAVEQYGKHFKINIGENFDTSLYGENSKEKRRAIRELRDMLATLKYEIWDTEHIKRAELRGDEWNCYVEKRFSEWSGFDINYINDMTYKPKDVTIPNDAFAFYKQLIPCRENGFLLKTFIEEETAMNRKEERAIKRKEKKERKAENKLQKTKGKGNKIFSGHMLELVIIFVVTCIAVVVISFFTVQAIRNIPQVTSQDSSEKYEATLMASGLAIIGIAISVWAGLNIANAIEKKEVEDIKSSVKGINEQFEKKKEDIEKAKKDVEEITQNVVTMRNERRDVNWNTFLLELLETSQDTVSRYFYEQFSETPIEWENIIEMVLLEQDFTQIYNNYGETSKVKNVLLDKAENCINRASRLLSTVDTIKNPMLEKLIRIYLHYRITEFHFMNGYMVDKEKSYDEFKLAAKGFKESQKLLKIDLPSKKDNLDFYVQRDNLELAIYFANSIGEACSKVTHRSNIPKVNTEEFESFKEEVNPYSEDAIFYLNIAVKLNEKLPQREVYYRNLGCAYERKDRNNYEFGTNAENIISNYKKALKAVISYEENKVKVENIYKTLLSYYHVWLNYTFKSINKESNIFSDKESFEIFMGNLKMKKDTLNEHTTGYLYDFNHVSELSVLDNPRFSLNRSMYGFSLSWIIVLLLVHKEEIENRFKGTIEEYLIEIHNCVLTLELMQMSDDYYKDLKNRYEILSAYCKEH